MKKNTSFLDFNLFKRLLDYVLVYKLIFVFVAVSAILISLFSTLTPYLIKVAVDDYLAVGKYEDFFLLICLAVTLYEWHMMSKKKSLSDALCINQG